MGAYGTCENCWTNHDGRCRDTDLLEAYINRLEGLLDRILLMNVTEDLARKIRGEMTEYKDLCEYFDHRS